MFGSYEYIPEVREEEERVDRNDPFLHGRRPTRLVVRGGANIDKARCMWVPGNVHIGGDVPEPTERAEGPFFPKLPKGMTGEAALRQLLAKSPLYAIAVYEKATATARWDVIESLITVVRQLVADGRYTRQLFEQTRCDRWSCRRILKGYASQCQKAAAMLQAIDCPQSSSQVA